MAACGLRVPVSLHGMFLRVHPSLRLLLEVWMKIRVQGCRDACPALRMDTAWYQGKQGSFCKTRTIFHTWLQPLDLCTVVSQDCSVQGGRKHLESVLCGCQGAWGRQAQLQVTALHPLTLRAGSHTSSSVPHAPTHTREQADTGAHGGERVCARSTGQLIQLSRSHTCSGAGGPPRPPAAAPAPRPLLPALKPSLTSWLTPYGRPLWWDILVDVGTLARLGVPLSFLEP